MDPKTLEELMKLSPAEREELVTPDWDNYDDEDDGPVLRLEHETEEFWAELDRRSAEGEANPDSDISLDELKRRLRALTGE